MDPISRHAENSDQAARTIRLLSVALARVAFTGIPPGVQWPSAFSRTDGR